MQTRADIAMTQTGRNCRHRQQLRPALQFCLSGVYRHRFAAFGRAALMLEEFLRHFDIPILAYLRNTQNYVNVAAAGQTIFDPPRSRFKRDAEQWADLLAWLEA